MELDQCINTATKESCKTKISSIHSKPFWTKALTISSTNLRKAKKAYSKRNTLSNEETMDAAKEEFDTLRKAECQSFILMKTKNLNVAQSKEFWRSLNQLFSKKDKTGVENLISESKPLTEPEEIEDCLFGTFFACKHLEIKGNEFDNLFLEEVNIIYSSIIDDTSPPINHG